MVRSTNHPGWLNRFWTLASSSASMAAARCGSTTPDRKASSANCSHGFDYKKKSLLGRHVDTEKHKRHLLLLDQGQAAKQQLLTSVVQRPPFVTDLAKMIVTCNIPLYKVEQPDFIQFMEKYCSKTLPSRSLLTKCMEEQSKEQLKKIKAKLLGKDLFLQADKTTDKQGRSMTAILAGPLDGESLGRPFLILVVDVVHNNNVTLQQVVMKALHGLFGEDLDYNRVKLLLTNAAAYCLKAGKAFQLLFPNLLHVSCLAHALNRVAELGRVTYPKVNLLISETKKIFVKSGNRKRDFAAACQMPLPPQPIHFNTVKEFVKGMEDDSQAIIETKKVFEDKDILLQLAIIRGNFSILERLPLVQGIELVEKLQERMTLEPFAEKLQKVLDKNPGFKQIQKVARVLRGSEEDFEGSDCNSVAMMANAPIVTCDAERVFSYLKDLNTPKRTRLTQEHVKDMLML
eukprot:maker-scaffold63_size435493-snap-gene-3.26 protein:Tk00833 transcript:maker-scaffold63_size435493-snap-gene-3.26-mRNA-1 annotation:"PREDICTED: uncharacterized protein LOC100897935"